jgi:hypothetical protein
MPKLKKCYTQLLILGRKGSKQAKMRVIRFNALRKEVSYLQIAQ